MQNIGMNATHMIAGDWRPTSGRDEAERHRQAVRRGRRRDPDDDVGDEAQGPRLEALGAGRARMRRRSFRTCSIASLKGPRGRTRHETVPWREGARRSRRVASAGRPDTGVSLGRRPPVARVRPAAAAAEDDAAAARPPSRRRSPAGCRPGGPRRPRGQPAGGRATGRPVRRVPRRRAPRAWPRQRAGDGAAAGAAGDGAPRAHRPVGRGAAGAAGAASASSASGSAAVGTPGVAACCPSSSGTVTNRKPRSR